MKDHSENVAQLCADIMSTVGLQSLGKITGLLHDAGKLKKEFQEYLKKNEPSLRGSINHSASAAVYVYNR